MSSPLLKPLPSSAYTNRWFILAVLVTARIAMGFQFQTVASVSPLIIKDLGIDYAELGTLIGIYMLPGVVFALPSGILGRRYGDANMVLIGLLLMGGGGLIMGVGDDYTTVSAGRILSGTGAIFINVLMTKMVADWFTDRFLVVAMSILIASWPLGLSLGLIVFPAIALIWSWSAVMLTASAVAFFSFVLLAWKYHRAPGSANVQVEGFGIGLLRREWLLTLLAGMAWGTFNVGYIIILSFGPGLFVQLGHGLKDAGFVVSLAGWLAIVMVPLGGYIAGRFGRVNLIMSMCFIFSGVGMSFMGLTAYPGFLLAAVALIGVLPAAMIVALPSEVLRPSARGAGIGVFFTVFYVCMALFPGIAGWMRDLTGDPVAPFYFGAFMMSSAAFSLLLFRVFAKKYSVEQDALT